MVVGVIMVLVMVVVSWLSIIVFSSGFNQVKCEWIEVVINNNIYMLQKEDSYFCFEVFGSEQECKDVCNVLVEILVRVLGDWVVFFIVDDIN